MSQLTSSPGFRPELGLPWFTRSMAGLSPEQVAAKSKDLLSFCFDTADMAPAFPAGTCVALRPVACLCKIEVGKVYVVLDKEQRLVAVGRLAQATEPDFPGYGLDLTLTHDSNGAEVLTGWRWPQPGAFLYALAYYGTVAIEAL